MFTISLHISLHESFCYCFQFHDLTLFSVDDIKAALRKRGPDSLGSKSISLHVHDGRIIRSSVEEEEPTILSNSNVDIDLNNGLVGNFLFVGATLQLRGVHPITQPLVDKSGNILVYNGMITYPLNLHLIA
ncbi:hypothetical protein Hdeb2414_s0028g00697441 [Helianthus debilis subsp. tardiflorus]